MSRAFSGIYFQTGEIAMSDFTDSHAALIESLGIKDTTSYHDRNWFKYEYVPREGNYAAMDSYRLIVDERGRPTWFDAEAEASLTARLKDRIAKRILMATDIPVLLGGKWILAGATRVGRVVNSIVISMSGSSKVGKMRGSSNVCVMMESSRVGEMVDSSKVGVMRDSSRVGVMMESSRVGEMRGSSSVGCDGRTP